MIMIADTLLKLLGENPEVYRDAEGKWITISVYSFDFITLLLPFILPLIPWFWLLWKKKTKKKINRQVIIKVILASIGLLIIGLLLPDWIMGIIASVAVNSIY